MDPNFGIDRYRRRRAILHRPNELPSSRLIEEADNYHRRVISRIRQRMERNNNANNIRNGINEEDDEEEEDEEEDIVLEIRDALGRDNS